MRAQKARQPIGPVVTECQAYRGYLIRYSARIIVRDGNPGFWIEKDGAFIGWARSTDDAKDTINMLTDTPPAGEI